MPYYEVRVTTGDKTGAGTDCNCDIVLLGKNGEHTKTAKLDNWSSNDFERAQVDVFKFKDDVDIPEVTEIKLRRDQAGLFSDWFVDKIEVLNLKSGVASVFPIIRWIRPGVAFYVRKYDTFLPQFDPRLDQRNAELQEKRQLYEYEEKILGLPVQVKKVPEDEEFSICKKWDIYERNAILIAGKTVEMILGGGSWKDLEDLKDTVSCQMFGQPKDMHYWESDEHFGWQRLNSVNPNLIRLCTKIPTKFGVTDENLKPFLEGLTISLAISKKRLFIVDFEILVGITCLEEYICPAPIALFFVNNKGHLVPVAIQLFQQKGSDNPVFLPSDPKYTWQIVKMWYNVADSNYHQAITHLGSTHFLMEGICIAANRCLSPSHPMFKLMAPHFLHIIAINNLGLGFLVSPGGWIDKTMAIGNMGVFELAAKGARSWRMDCDGRYPEFLKSRGLYCKDGSILPMFYQRDDMMALYDAINNYVTKYVNLYYDSSQKIESDVEIHNFGQELVKGKSKGGCGLVGVPFKDEKFSTPDQLILVFTCAIFTSSVVHAAANFSQYDAYGFPPNYPLKLKGAPPKNKDQMKEEDIIKCLADKSSILDTMVITTILSERTNNALGDFEVTYTYDPAAVDIVEEFKKELQDIKTKIQQRNEKLERGYDYLLPTEIPNSISI